MVDFSRATNLMSGNLEMKLEVSNSGLNSESSDIEILDYIMVMLCHCLDTSKMAFKGGYILNKIMPVPVSRDTRDIDFSIAVIDYYKDVSEVLSKVGDNLVADGVIQSYEVKETITSTSSGGIKLHRNSSKLKDMGVDVGLHDIDHGVVPMSIIGIDANRFSTERILSDKISAIFSRKRFRRPKDLYDFYILTNCFNVSMSDLLNEVNIRSAIDWDASPFRDEVKVQYKKAYDSLIITNPKNSEKVVSKPDFGVVLDRVFLFYNNWDQNLIWNCSDRSFENAQ